MRKLYVNKETKEVLHVSAFPETDLKPADGKLLHDGVEVECITEHTEGFDWGDTYTPPPPPHIPTFDEKLYTSKRELFQAMQLAHQEVLMATLPDELTREQIDYLLVHGIKPVGSQFWQKWEYRTNEAFDALPETGPQDNLSVPHGDWHNADYRKKNLSKKKVREFFSVIHPDDTHDIFGSPSITAVREDFLSWYPTSPVPVYGVWERLNGEGFLRFRENGDGSECVCRDHGSYQSDNVRLRANWLDIYVPFDDSSVQSCGAWGWVERTRNPIDLFSSLNGCGYNLVPDLRHWHGYRAEGNTDTRPANRYTYQLWERKA